MKKDQGPPSLDKHALSILESNIINASPFQADGGPQHEHRPNESSEDIIEGEFKREDRDPEKLNKKD